MGIVLGLDWVHNERCSCYRKPVGEQHVSYNVVVQDIYVMSAIATTS
jgi:hypothetical protein